MPDRLNLALTDHTIVASRVDLIGGRFRLLNGSYVPKVGKRAKVAETLLLRADGTPTQIAAGEQDINDLLERARRWQEDPNTTQGVWLEWSVDGEPGAGTYAAKRAFLYDGELALANWAGGKGAFTKATVRGTMGIVRHPCWENVVYEELTSAAVPLDGGTVDLTGEAGYMGTEPGRILRTSLVHSHGQVRTWIGIRPLYEGIAAFNAVWECENGTNAIADTTDVADATASPSGGAGIKVQTTFVTSATMTERFQLLVGDILMANYEDMVGGYLVLLRAKVSAAATCYLRMRSGWDTGTQRSYGDYVEVSSTNWHIYELGTVNIPGAGYRDEADPDPRDWGIWLDAERVSGAGNLECDVLYMVPSWALAMIDNQANSSTVGAALSLVTLADDTQRTYEVLVGPPQVITQPDVATSNWLMPREPGVLVVVGDETAGHVLTRTADLTMYYYPRWRLYRAV